MGVEIDTYDVFLSHNSKNKAAVRQLADLLRKHELAVWLDEDELPPGQAWQPLLERGIRQSRSFAVLIGKDGLGPWQDEEMQVALALAVRESRKVIPVFLPDAPRELELPMFLANRTWVDLRPAIGSDNFERLILGITGKKRSMSGLAGATSKSFVLDDSRGSDIERLALATAVSQNLEPQKKMPKVNAPAGTSPSTRSVPGSSAEPFIVSLWHGKGDKDFLCTGLLLTGRHILTVKHAFEGWPDDRPVYLRLINGVGQLVEATVLQRHRDKDAAILHFQTAVRVAGKPNLLDASENFDRYSGRRVLLWVVDPLTFGRIPLGNYSTGGFDQDTGEYIVSPENARGHSGGVVELDGQIIGLLSRRNVGDPLCRAVAMHLLWPWINSTIGDEFKVREEPAAHRVSGPSAGYRAMVERVRSRIRERLKSHGMDAIVRSWSGDPLANFDPGHPGEQLQALLNGLHLATECGIQAWKGQPADTVAAMKMDCRFILSELVKLAVDLESADADLAAVDTGSSEHIYLACQFAGTADVVYCALGDLAHVLKRHDEDHDVVSSNAVHVDDLLPVGCGKNLQQAISQKLWEMVIKDGKLPTHIDDKLHDVLVRRIKRHHKRDEKRYLLSASGPRKWCADSEYRDLANTLEVGLVLRGEGECTHLLMDEPELIDTVHEYLQLLETF